MKVVILAGGFGSRLSEETHLRPKPMVEIGGKPIIWHIMKHYSHHGFNEFVICLGYMGYVIKEYFVNYYLHLSDITVDVQTNSYQTHDSKAEPWKVTLVDTGAETMTGGRVRRAAPFLGGEPFFLTYGDGVGDIDVAAELDFHRAHGKLMTVMAVQPSGRFGALALDGDAVHTFAEKPAGDGSWINGGFFICEPGVIDYIAGDDTVFERDPVENLARDGQIQAFKHHGFWRPMDTLRDKNELQDLWDQGRAPWKTW